jgi:hypothetical protein
VTYPDLEIAIALAALGMADADELAQVDAAAARDPTIACDRAALADVAACLPLALPVARPPPRVLL